MALRIKASAKVHRRYLLLKGSKSGIEKAILDYIGVWGWSRAAPKFVKKSGVNWVLAVDRSAIDLIRGAFAVCADKIQVLKVSGTLKGLGVRG